MQTKFFINGEFIVGEGQKGLQAAAGSIKRTHLELGGKAPMIVFEDADLDKDMSMYGLEDYTSVRHVMVKLD